MRALILFAVAVVLFVIGWRFDRASYVQSIDNGLAAALACVACWLLAAVLAIWSVVGVIRAALK